MIIDSKHCSIQLAVTAFFVTTCVGSLCGLSPFTCCKRALISALIIYALCRCTVKVLNRIILSALVRSQMNKQEESVSASNE
jgi:hypothetical protein